MKAVLLVIAMVLMAGVCYADQTIEVKVPDSFSASDITYVQELANVAIQRILERPLVPEVNAVELVKVEIDRVRKANGLTAKFTAAEEIAIEK